MRSNLYNEVNIA